MKANLHNIVIYVICVAALNFFAFQLAGSADATQGIEGEIALTKVKIRDTAL